MSEFVPFCPCCQTYETDDKHQNHCFLGHAEKRIESLESKVMALSAELEYAILVSDEKLVLGQTWRDMARITLDAARLEVKGE